MNKTTLKRKLVPTLAFLSCCILMGSCTHKDNSNSTVLKHRDGDIVISSVETAEISATTKSKAVAGHSPEADKNTNAGDEPVTAIQAEITFGQEDGSEKTESDNSSENSNGINTDDSNKSVQAEQSSKNIIPATNASAQIYMQTAPTYSHEEPKYELIETDDSDDIVPESPNISAVSNVTVEWTAPVM